MKQIDPSTQIEYEVVVGCEIHAQLVTQTKAFCRCLNQYGGIPNSRICPVCMGLPGALPKVNKKLVDLSVLAGMAFGSTISDHTQFARKNYYYPDLPKGYQISQYQHPICQGGSVSIEAGEALKKIRIHHIQMEEDAGKILNLTEGSSQRYVDFNRAGAPLIEIISEPDMQSAAEAVSFVQSAREILMYLSICDGNMEEGALRCDVNVNLHIHEKDQTFSTPIGEIKNMNSFKAIRGAIHFEITRQLAEWKTERRTLKEYGKKTLGYDEKTEQTFVQRKKEEAQDYRFFPEPDLKTIALPEDYKKQIASLLTELPLEKRRRFMKQYDLSSDDVSLLSTSIALGDYFEQAAAYSQDPKKTANWILTEVLSAIHRQGISIQDFSLTPLHLGELIKMIATGQINGKQAKDVFAKMISTGENAQAIVSYLGLTQITDKKDLAKLIEGILEENPKSVKDFLQGKDHALKFLMGQLMKKTQGKANPTLASEIFLEKLNETNAT